MDNSSYRSQFIQSNIEKENLSGASVQVINAFWKRIERAERELGKKLEDGYSKEEYISLIEKLNVTSLHVLMPTKSRIGQYLKWLSEQGALDREYAETLYSVTYDDIKPEVVYESKYFKDFGSLQNAIESTLWAAEKVDDDVYAMQISVIYLAWCGLTIEEALQIKKSDVGEDSIAVGEKVISPIGTIMKYIQDYRDATEYQSQGRSIITLKYIPSEWLFRSSRTDHVDSPKRMRIYIRMFGQSSGEPNIFNYDKVYWSGVFNRAYIYECSHGPVKPGDIEKIEMLFGEKYASVSYANKRLYEYHRFKNHFFPTPATSSDKDA